MSIYFLFCSLLIVHKNSREFVDNLNEKDDVQMEALFQSHFNIDAIQTVYQFSLSFFSFHFTPFYLSIYLCL